MDGSVHGPAPYIPSAAASNGVMPDMEYGPTPLFVPYDGRYWPRSVCQLPVMFDISAAAAADALLTAIASARSVDQRSSASPKFGVNVCATSAGVNMTLCAWPSFTECMSNETSASPSLTRTSAR